MKRKLGFMIALVMLLGLMLPTGAQAGSLDTLTIKYNSVRIRSAASTASSILATVNQGKSYPYISTGAKDASGYAWYMLRFSSTQNGFVREDLANLVQQSAPTESALGELTVTAGGRLNVRASYSATSAKLGVLEDGSKHAYYATQSGWYRIRYGSTVGWVSGRYVKVSSTDTVQTPPPPVETALGQLTVMSGGTVLNVRATPSLYGTRLGTVSDRALHAYYAEQSGWYKIKYGTGYGWVSGKYVLLNGAAPPADSDPKDYMGPNLILQDIAMSPILPLSQVSAYEVKTKAELNLRSGADLSFPVITTIPKEVTLKREELLPNGWAKVTYQGTTGYIKADSAYVSTLAVVWRADAAFGALDREGTDKSLGVSAVENALLQLGKPYQWGAEGAFDYDRDGDVRSGFDCSGLVQWAYWMAGKSLPRTTATGYTSGTAIAREQVEIGDLIYFKTEETSSPVTHVAMYFGNDIMLHASESFTMTTLSSVYWDKMVTIRRHSR